MRCLHQEARPHICPILQARQKVLGLQSLQSSSSLYIWRRATYNDQKRCGIRPDIVELRYSGCRTGCRRHDICRLCKRAVAFKMGAVRGNLLDWATQSSKLGRRLACPAVMEGSDVVLLAPRKPPPFKVSPIKSPTTDGDGREP